MLPRVSILVGRAVRPSAAVAASTSPSVAQLWAPTTSAASLRWYQAIKTPAVRAGGKPSASSDSPRRSARADADTGKPGDVAGLLQFVAAGVEDMRGSNDVFNVQHVPGRQVRRRVVGTVRFDGAARPGWRVAGLTHGRFVGQNGFHSSM